MGENPTGKSNRLSQHGQRNLHSTDSRFSTTLQKILRSGKEDLQGDWLNSQESLQRRQKQKLPSLLLACSTGQLMLTNMEELFRRPSCTELLSRFMSQLGLLELLVLTRLLCLALYP